ncbi:MAG: DJ-1/PfpI/YhbO family deglycase/protease [Acidobacteriia bacterium]|nr:DJ-1/PfpI/YhbO family deglycase/protease [Terriglobia bacterium]
MVTKKLSDKKVVMVIAPDQFRDEELLVPRQILEAAGATVKVASRSKMECTGMLGAKVKPDLLISEVKMADFDAIVVVGGMGSPEYLWGDRRLHALLGEAKTSGKTTAAICLSGAVLARAGVLAGHRATVYKTADSMSEFEKGGAVYTGEPVTVDGNLVTGENPDAARAFGEAIVAKLTTPLAAGRGSTA